MSRVWLVGARGMLGQAVARHLQATAVDVVTTDMELDITNAAAVDNFAQEMRPSHVLNCAAYTQVDTCETQDALAEAVNGVGPGHVGAAAANVGAVAVHVSTDYVFNGTANTPYTEDSPCDPLGVYGRSKRHGEEAFLQAFAGAAAPARAIVVRTSWLFGRDGKNFVSTMLQLFAKREELRVVADQFGRPTYCEDLAEAMLALAGLTRDAPAVGGIYHFANSGQLSWHGFAEAIWHKAKERGKSLACQRVHAIGTGEYPTPARRPAYSVLDTSKITAALGRAPRAWDLALDDYLNSV